MCGDVLDVSEGWRPWGMSFHADELGRALGGGVCVVCVGLTLSRSSAQPDLRLVGTPREPSKVPGAAAPPDAEVALAHAPSNPLHSLDYESQVDLLAGDVAHTFGNVIDTVIEWGNQLDGGRQFSPGDAAVLRTLLAVRDSLAGAGALGGPDRHIVGPQGDEP